MHRQPELFEGQLGRGRAATCELPRAACELPRAATCCCRLLPPVLTGRTFEPPFLYKTNVEIGVVIKASDAAEVEELRARFPIELAPDAAFATSASSRRPPRQRVGCRCAGVFAVTTSATSLRGASSCSTFGTLAHVAARRRHLSSRVSGRATRLQTFRRPRRTRWPGRAHCAPTAAEKTERSVRHDGNGSRYTATPPWPLNHDAPCVSWFLDLVYTLG